MMGRPTNPFRGLTPFTAKDKLFGRDRDLMIFRDRMLTGRTTLLFAGSGVGKTSFLEASVLPDLEHNGYWVCHYRTWANERPLEALGSFLDAQLAKRGEPLRQALEHTASKATEGDERDALVRVCEKVSTASSLPYEALKSRFQPVTTELPRLQAVASSDTLARTLPSAFILILDQFEEVFQYHAYRDFFPAFLDQLSRIVNDQELEVRLVLSLREEYLGELTAFDNKIPDPLSNNYRLRCPTLDEAARIVRSTCNESGMRPDETGLKALLRELATIEIGAGSAAERPTGDRSKPKKLKKPGKDQPEKPPTTALVRTFVPPPYLQLVCKALWDKTPEGTAEQPFAFLANYQDQSATLVLSEYCKEKLKPLGLFQRRLAARAFDFLVTQNGAKMAYEAGQLAAHLKTTEKRLLAALEPLSKPETLILRKSPSPAGSPWFELYHDMYGRIIHRWKSSFNSRFDIAQGLIVMGVCAAFFTALAVVSDRQSRAQAAEIRNQVDRTSLTRANLDEPGSFLVAKESFERLQGVDRAEAHGLWGEAWSRRAQAAEERGEATEALLYWLTALNVGDPSNGPRYRRGANRLVETPFASLTATFRSPGLDGMVPVEGNNADSFLTWAGRDVSLWSITEPRKPGRTFSIPVPLTSVTNRSDQSGSQRAMVIWQATMLAKLGLRLVGADGGSPFGWIEESPTAGARSRPGPSGAAAAGDLERYLSLRPPEGSLESVSLSTDSADMDPFHVLASESLFGSGGDITGEELRFYRRSLIPDSSSKEGPDPWLSGASFAKKEVETRVSASHSVLATWPAASAQWLNGNRDRTIDVNRVDFFRCGPPSRESRSPGSKAHEKLKCEPIANSNIVVPSGVEDVTLDKDGQWLAVTSDKALLVFERGKTEPAWQVENRLGSPDLTLLDDGKRLVATTSEATYTWEYPGGEPKRVLATGILSASGRTVLSNERNQEVRSWDLESGKHPRKGAPRPGNAKLTGDGQALVEMDVALKSLTLRRTGEASPVERALDGLNREASNARYRPTLATTPFTDRRGDTVAALVDNGPMRRSLLVWNSTKREQPALVFPLSGSTLPAVALDDSGRYLAFSDLNNIEPGGKRLRLLRLSDGVDLSLNPSAANRIRFSPKGEYVGAMTNILSRRTSDTGGLAIWKTSDGTALKIPRTAWGVKAFELRDRRMVALDRDSGTPMHWRYGERSVEQLRSPNPIAVYAVNLAGTVAAGVTDDDRLIVWDLATGLSPNGDLRIEGGSPTHVVFAGKYDDIFIVMNSRVHRVTLGKDRKPRFAGTRYFSGSVIEAKGIEGNTDSIRLLLRINEYVTDETIAFDTDSGPELQGEPRALLDEWQNRVGRRVDARGVVSPITID